MHNVVVERLRALEQLGLGACADAELDVLARRVSERVRADIGLVSLMQADGLVYPGQYGLDAERARSRAAAFEESLCPRVVEHADAVVVADTRIDDHVANRRALVAAGVLAYAGSPVTDSAGVVLGTVCAVHHTPRRWSAADLVALGDVARECSTQLRLRLAQYDAHTAQQRADDLRAELERTLQQSQLLLVAMETLAGAQTVPELRDRIAQLVAGELAPARVELVITENASAQTAREDHRDPTPESVREAAPGQWTDFDGASARPVAHAARVRALVQHEDLRTTDATTLRACEPYLGEGLVAVVCAPVLDTDHTVLAVLEFAWDQPHRAAATEQAVILGIAGYVAAALRRIRFLQRRISVARELQLAMLTDLPALPGLTTATRYVPASETEYVGGDWYDAFVLPGTGCVVLAIGDVTGHDIRAATVMGQLRAMLRQACWQHPTHSPANILVALDHAADALGVAASGTMLLATLHPAETGTGQWTLTWSNAGHPPPVVVTAEGGTHILHEHDHLFGYPTLITAARTDHAMTLRPGTSIVLYTDGLIEHTGTDLDTAIHTLAENAAATTHSDPDTLADAVLTASGNDTHPDDTALLILHIPTPPAPSPAAHRSHARSTAAH